MIKNNLREELIGIVGEKNFSTDAAECDLATSDIFDWPERKPAVAVVRPATTEEVSQVVSALRPAAVPLVPRGAGLSYSGGMAAGCDSVVLETSRLDSIEVDAGNLVATVGAGASWQSVSEALATHDLVSRQPSPISGQYSTVGGLASQGLPAGTDGILGLSVVLPDASVIRTGTRSGAMRPAPDLTSLFLGDCGAFGIKTEVVIRLARRPAAGFATFQFETVPPLIEVLGRCMREGLVSRAFAMDNAKAEQAKAVDGDEGLRAAVAVLRKSDSLMGAAQNAAKLIGFTASRSEAAQWSLHLTIESATSEGVQAQLRAVRAICSGPGREAPDIFPRTLHAKPYSARGLVGPQGERWVPLHGIFPLADAEMAVAALQDKVKEMGPELAKHGVTVSWLLSSSGSYLLVEPMFYWSDHLDGVHIKYLSPRNRDRFGSFDENPETRKVVRRLREALRESMDANGASHCQIGRFYHLDSQMDHGLFRQLEQWKKLLDPANTLNPGVLGLGEHRTGRE